MLKTLTKQGGSLLLYFLLPPPSAITQSPLAPKCNSLGLAHHRSGPRWRKVILSWISRSSPILWTPIITGLSNYCSAHYMALAPTPEALLLCPLKLKVKCKHNHLYPQSLLWKFPLPSHHWLKPSSHLTTLLPSSPSFLSHMLRTQGSGGVVYLPFLRATWHVLSGPLHLLFLLTSTFSYALPSIFTYLNSSHSSNNTFSVSFP